MRALPVQPQPVWRTDFRQRIAVSLWFLPTIFAAIAIVAANVTIWLDAKVDAPIGVRPDLVSDPGSAATFAGAIAAATLAFVAVVFATTLVAIQLAASQYSPRTVRIFIRSRVTRVTLGLFLATFVFSVIILVSNRASVTSATQFAPVVSVTTLLALTVATVFGFVAYLHGVVRLMRVQYLLETIAAESRRAIEESFRVDASGTVRVKRKLRNFDGLLVLALTEVIRYGADAPQVVRRLHGLLDELQATLPAQRQAAITGQRSLLEAAVSAALPAPFVPVASVPDREGLG